MDALLDASQYHAAIAGAKVAIARQDTELYRKLNWMDHPLIEGPYINYEISGNPEVNWLMWVRQKYVPRRLVYGLSLGCGEGGLERHAMAMRMCAEFDAFDISPEAIALARQKAEVAGIAQRVHYAVRDVNLIQLLAERYDIAFFSSALHHIQRLESVLAEVNKSLKSGGLFVVNEFVGPSQFQWTDKQLRIINDLLALLPPRYRVNLRDPSQLKERVKRPTIAEMNAFDPSEAIRSAEIIPLIEKQFQVAERIDYGGTILHMLLNDIVGNFDPRAEADQAIIRLLCYLEWTLIREGVLTSDFAVIVSRRKP